MKENIKLEAYNAANQFIIAYAKNNKEVLLSKYEISEENIKEMDEFLNFVEDKIKIHIFPISEIDNPVCFFLNPYKDDYSVKCLLEYEEIEFYMIFEYNKTKDNRYKFQYSYFDL